MKYEPSAELLGTPIRYKDYLGYDRFGSIAWVEPAEQADIEVDPGKFVAWIYIADEDLDMNTHQLNVVYRGEQKTICYCDLRISTEVFLDTDGGFEEIE